jgi:hypothetical protein
MLFACLPGFEENQHQRVTPVVRGARVSRTLERFERT